MTRVAAAGLLVFSLSGAWAAPADTQSFEVASVKVRPGGANERGIRKDAITAAPAGVTMINVPLKAIIQWAYHLQAIQVQGPGWIDSDRFDIIAKAGEPVPNERLREMTQTLLSQRFKMTLHKESKELQAYVITVMKSGHKLKQSEGEGEMDVKPAPNKMAALFTHVTLSELSEMVSSPLQAIVVDQTGLKGSWDFTLDMSSFMTQVPTGMDDMVNMLVQAAAEQLGIKIELKKLPADVYLIDHAERIPVEN